MKDFTASFNLNASNLIVPTHHNLAVYKDFQQLLQLDDYDQDKISEFIKATPINKRPLITSSGEVFLSTKELECLNLLASGKNAKQIAQVFKASARTVEKHLEHIKHKMGGGDKASIIKVYKDSVLNWL